MTGFQASGAPPLHAVLLTDMGGPQCAAEVRRYLQKIFSDPFIIPGHPVKRWLLSRLISRMSTAKTRRRYAQIGGRSRAVSDARRLGGLVSREFGLRGIDVVCDVATRYSQPDIASGLERLLRGCSASARPECREQPLVSVVYLFPHESRSLTGSCEAVLNSAARQMGVSVPYQVRRLSRTEAYVEGWTNAIRFAASCPEKTFVLLTAHSLPCRLLRQEDVYVTEVQRSVEEIRRRLGPAFAVRLAWQSQEGRDWLGPSAEQVLAGAAGADREHLVVAPLSFVGDSTETLLDIDVDLFQTARMLGFEQCVRIPPPGRTGWLTDMVVEALCREWGVDSEQ